MLADLQESLRDYEGFTIVKKGVAIKDNAHFFINNKQCVYKFYLNLNVLFIVCSEIPLPGASISITSIFPPLLFFLSPYALGNPLSFLNCFKQLFVPLYMR